MCPQDDENLPRESIVPGSLGEPEVDLAPAQFRISTFASLAIPDYRWYWIGLLAYFSAMQMQMLAQGWLVYQMTDSVVALGLVSATFGIPILLFSMIGGVLADRLDKRQIMIVTQIALSVLMLIIAILVSTNTIRLWHLVIGAFLAGLAFVFNVPARQSIIPELVDRNRLLNSISLNSLGMNATRIVGPGIAGALIALVSISLVYYIVAALYILAAVSLYGISKNRVPTLNVGVTDTSKTAKSIFSTDIAGFLSKLWIDLKEGINYVLQSRAILLLMLMAFVPLTFGLPYLNLMPVFAKDIFQMGAEGLGFMAAAAGLGAMAGSLVIASLGDFRHKGMLILVLALVFGLSLIAFSLSQNFGLSMAMLLIVGGAGAGYMAVNNTLIQSNTPPRMLGRVMSIYVLTFSLMPLGTLPISAIAEMIGVGTAIALGGIIVFAFTVVMALSQSTLRHLP